MIGAIIQARLGSKRLPNKVLLDIYGKPALQHVIERVQRINGLQKIIVATPDEPVANLAEQCGVLAFRSTTPEDDVLTRYFRCSREHKLDVIMRITADCPLLDPAVSQRVLDKFIDTKNDYVSNTIPPTFPDGLDTEVFSIYALTMATQEADTSYDREHVTPFIKKRGSGFKTQNLWNSVDQSMYRWTLDTSEDLAFIRNVYTMIGTEDFGLEEVMDLIRRFPSMAYIHERL